MDEKNIPQQSSEHQVSAKELVARALLEINEGITEIKTLDDIERLTFSVLDCLPESTNLAKKINEARAEGNRTMEAVLVTKQKRIYEGIYGELALIAGVETDDSRVARENEDYRARALTIVEDIEEEDINNGYALRLLGMTRFGDSGRIEFTYPKDLFPPHINEKWSHYIEVVAQHMKAIENRKNGVSNDVALIAQLDAVRTAAHNNLSLAIKKFLQLDSWDLEKCRNLVIKMRDSRIPNVKTAEQEVTSREVARFIQAVKTISLPH